MNALHGYNALYYKANSKKKALVSFLALRCNQRISDQMQSEILFNLVITQMY